MIDREEYYAVNCGDCAYHHGLAYRDDYTNYCKRVDNKHIKFYKSPFASYNCGESNKGICSDFYPKESYVYLHDNWVSFDDLYNWREIEGLNPKDVALVLDSNFDTIYHIKYNDFCYNRFIKENGELRWFKKTYAKRTYNGGLWFKLITEFNAENLEPWEIDYIKQSDYFGDRWFIVND